MVSTLKKSSLPSNVLAPLQAGHVNYTYKGIPAIKCPFDLALYTLLIWNLKPRTIIEIGSNAGGSALWLADQIRACQIDGHVWSYDVNPVSDLRDPLVYFKYGDAMNLGTSIDANEIRSLPGPFLIIEDASHHRAASLSVLNFFDPLTQPGDYIIVEDGIVTDLGIADQFDGGPGAAIDEFLAAHVDKWVIDRSYCDFFGINVTWNVNGYLKKVA